MAGYVKFHKSKADWYSRQLSLVRMTIAKRPFKGIVIDCLRELLESEGFYAILVARDQFAKVRYYILAKPLGRQKRLLILTSMTSGDYEVYQDI